MDLQTRINHAITEGREKAAERATGIETSAIDEAVQTLIGWLYGIEDALMEIALEVEALAARLDEKASAAEQN